MTSLPSGGRRGPLFQLGCTFGWKSQSQPPLQEGFQPQRQLLGGCWCWSCSPEHLAKSAGLVHVRGTGSQGRSIFKFSSQQESWYVGNLFPGCFLSAGGSGKPSRLVLAASVSELLLGRHIEKLLKKPSVSLSPAHPTLLGIRKILPSTFFHLNLNRTFQPFPGEKQQRAR